MQELNNPGAVYLISSGGILSQIFSPVLSSELVPYLKLVDAQEYLRQDSSQPLDQGRDPQIILLDIRDPSLSERVKTKIQGTGVYKSIPLVDLQAASATADQQLIEKIHRISEQGFKFRARITASSDRKEMVFIPAGGYSRRRGISPSFSDDQKGARAEFFTQAFYMDRFPVTNREYRDFTLACGHPAPGAWRGGKYSSGKGDHPATGIRWEDVLAYAGWSGKQTPTPDQWEKAAFGEQGHNFPWGENFDAGLCNVFESEVGSTTPVGHYSPQGDSPYGISDLFGNVWEWVYDWTSSAETRMLLGGAYDTPCRYLLAPFYARVHANPGLSGANFGFRLCSELKIQDLEDI